MELQSLLQARQGATILTPHPAEAGRLLGIGTHDAQQDRVGAAVRLARRYHSLVVLKGAGSICAAPDGRWFVNLTGNLGMSSAGMGDALSGMIGALVAQGVGPIGLTASEVIKMARTLLNRWVQSCASGARLFVAGR